MTSFAEDFREFVRENPTEKAGDNAASSGSSRLHRGLKNPTMRQFAQTWADAHASLTYDDWQDTLSELYQGEWIDEACLAGFMLGHYDQYRNELPLNVLGNWIDNLHGWREIDTSCQSNYTAKEILQNWEAWHPFLVDLSQRDTIQHRRASLVLLVKPLLDSDDERFISAALSNVETLKHEKDKLITKAVSRILRSAVKRHRETVGTYVFNNEQSLPSIALREFKKKFTTGRK